MTKFATASPEPGTQPYTNWVVEEKQRAQAGSGEDARNTADSCEALSVSNTHCKNSMTIFFGLFIKIQKNNAFYETGG